MTIRRALIMLVVGIAVTLIVTRGFEKLLLAMSMVGRARQAIIGDSGHSVSYLLREEKWISFDIPAGHGRVKLVTNGACPRSAELYSDREIIYAVRYRILDERNQIARDRSHYFRSRVAREVVDARGAVADRLFFIESEHIPAEGRIAFLDLSGTNDLAKTVLLRVHETDDVVQRVLCRVYFERELSSAQNQFRWERLSRRQRARLARTNVYSPGLLTDEEKIRYSRREWVAVAPRGVVGRDYRTRVLYRRRDEPNPPAVDEFTAGLRVRRGHRGIIPVPEGMHRVSLVAVRTAQSAGREAPARVSVKWYGRSPGDERRYVLKLVGGRGRIERWMEGGLLEIASGVEVSVRAFVNDGGEEITPEALVVRGYLTETNRPVTFPVSHIGDLATPFRVDLRAFRVDEKPSWLDGELSAAYQLVGRQGEVVAEGILSGEIEESIYDQLLGGGEESSISDPVKSCFAFPAGTAELRIRAIDRPLLVNAYNQVPWAAKDVRVPEDYYAYSRSRSKERGWFLVRPRGHLDLAREAKSRVVVVQYRPPERSEELKEGEYRWESFRPEGDWSARALLVRRDIADFEEKGLASSVYVELSPAREHLVDIISNEAEKEPGLRLVWVRESSDGGFLRVDVDSVTALDLELEGRGGQALLPPVPLGPHVVRCLSSPGTRVFLSNVGNDAGDRYVRRLAVEIDGRPLTYTFVKHRPGEDHLLGRIYLSEAFDRRVAVCMRLVGPGSAVGPHEDWTFRSRRFDVRPAGTGEAVVVGGGWRRIRNGELFLFPVRADVPEGEYDVVLEFQEKLSGLVTLARITEGETERFRFYRR